MKQNTVETHQFDLFCTSTIFISSTFSVLRPKKNRQEKKSQKKKSYPVAMYPGQSTEKVELMRTRLNQIYTVWQTLDKSDFSRHLSQILSRSTMCSKKRRLCFVSVMTSRVYALVKLKIVGVQVFFGYNCPGFEKYLKIFGFFRLL